MSLKMPPSSLETEKSIIASMLVSPKIIDEYIEDISSEIFYSQKNRTIMEAIQALYSSSKQIDTLTVLNQLKASESVEQAGGDVYLSELMSGVSTTLNLSTHIETVQGKFDVRRIIETCNSALSDAYAPNVDAVELLGRTESSLLEIYERSEKGKFEHISKLIVPSLDEINKIRQNGGKLEMPTGFEYADKLTGGHHAGELTILAGRPGMGKTAIMMDLAINSGVPCAVFSLEMPKLQLAQRLQARFSKVPMFVMRNGSITDSQFDSVSKVSTELSKLQIHIDDTPGLNILVLRSKLRRLIKKHGIKLVFIDYLQLMNGIIKNQETTRKLEDTTKALKELTKELNIHIVALAQLNRGLEKRPIGSRRPQLSDLKGSGSIEQDADVVLFIYRHYMYTNAESDKHLGELIISKQRSGPSGVLCDIIFDNSITSFRDIDPEIENTF